MSDVKTKILVQHFQPGIDGDTRKQSNYPDLQLDPLVLPEDRLDLEVDPDRRDEGGGEGIVGVAEQEAVSDRVN